MKKIGKQRHAYKSPISLAEVLCLMPLNNFSVSFQSLTSASCCIAPVILPVAKMILSGAIFRGVLIGTACAS